MAERRMPSLAWVLPLVLVAGVVLAVLLVSTGAEDEPGAGESPTASVTPTAAPPTTQAAPEAFCTAFRAFADAQSGYVAAPEDAAAEQALVDAAEALLGLGRPLGLSEGGLVSLQQLVDGSLSQAGDPTTDPDAAAPDPAALDAYLASSCPA